MTAVPEIDRASVKSFKDISKVKSNQPFSSRRKKNTDNQIHLVTSCNHFSAFKKYKIKRESITNIKGHKFLFQFIGEQSKYYAKFKARPLGDYIVIQDNPKVHLSDKHFTAVLLHANGLCDFSLRLNERFGPEIIALQFSTNVSEEGEQAPRILTAHLFGETNNLPNKIKNRTPYETNEGLWQVDLGYGYAISSIKNCTLVDEKEKPLVHVRKIEDDTLEIEAIEEFDELRLFAIGIAAFLCKI
ncbi:hypothetical protein TRFO_25411 [Tritrichomonas foetus]|uniref:Tubby C-terminal domain-containing protein n=1 Tax=Tritrichomonas foetus TaxID=1144522 RepID=A0A1J4K558_9EUKA|nr:hypothetical protein TRFO_25411 [Tritrichomonas foetus]|eukprot:OHT06527.1 hypothetical protein TRFO_25411 [Tritrichomonas foetus]